MLAHCKFCDFQIIADREFKTEEEAAEYATMHCDCGDTFQYRADKEREELREKNVRRIEGAIESVRGFCRKRGVFFVEDTTEVLRNGAMCVLDEFIDAINIKISQIKIVIQKNSKGVLIFKKITAKRTRKRSFEENAAAAGLVRARAALLYTLYIALYSFKKKAFAGS